MPSHLDVPASSGSPPTPSSSSTLINGNGASSAGASESTLDESGGRDPAEQVRCTLSRLLCLLESLFSWKL
jgi:hypothetical protein